MLLVLGLLGGTAVAFAITESLKLEPSPIRRPKVVPPVFSPVCACEKETASIGFRLRKADEIIVEVVDAGGKVVRTLLPRTLRRGTVRLRWDGRDEDGKVVGEGRYRPRVALARQERTIDLPNTIRVDTTPPTLVLLRPPRRSFSPNGDGVAEGINARYRVDEPAHGLLYVDAAVVARTRFQRLEDQVAWYGSANGRPFPAGVHSVSVGAEDTAGNRSRRTRAFRVRISR